MNTWVLPLNFPSHFKTCNAEKDGSEDNTTSGSSGSPTPGSTPIPTSTPVSPSPSSTSPSAPSSSSTPSPFQFISPGNLTLCQSAMLTWQYSAPVDIAMTITITNERAVGQGQTSNSSLVSRMLTDSVSSKAQEYFWEQVDISDGPYVALAFDTNHTANILSTSPTFFVIGQNQSCITDSPTSPTSSSTTTGSSDSPSPVSPTATSQTDSGGGSKMKTLSSGALAGTIVGVAVGVILLLLAFTFPHFLRHSLPRPSRTNRRPGGPYILF
ncbi:hypothetical protein ABKN59_003067 [Abortiporus biennis]